MSEQNNAINSLAHSKWNCKYHVVFAPKYRRKVFYEEKRKEIREIIRTLSAPLSGNNCRGRKKPVISRVFELLKPLVATKWQHFQENNCNRIVGCMHNCPQ